MATGMPNDTKPVSDLPAKETSDFAWRGSIIRESPARWRTALTAEQIDEIVKTATRYVDDGNDLAAIDQASFPLPASQSVWADLQHDLIAGIGFRLVEGLDPTGWSREVAAAVFLGIGAHLGLARSQNGAGHLLGHVKDVGLASSDPNVRIYQTSERQTFHTDSADVVGLLCLNEAREGGDSLLVSAVTIFNEMHDRRPDLALELMQPIATDRRGEVPEGAEPFFTIPVFTHHDAKITGMYQRQYIESAQRFENAPRLSDKTIEALDLFDELANDPDLHLTMRLKPGDLQFVHNHTMLHDRTGFVDWEEPERRRHLMRLWLSIPGDRQLAPVFEQRFGSITPGNRGGIIVPGTAMQVPLDVARVA